MKKLESENSELSVTFQQKVVRCKILKVGIESRSSW